MVAAVQKPMSSSDPSSVQPASSGSYPAGGGGSNGGSGSSSGGAPSTSSSAPEPAQVSLPGMVHLSQVSPPSSFNFQAADQWDRWLRRFNRYRQASGLHTQPESVQVNSLLYTMGEQADDLLDSFHLPEDDVSKFTTVTERFQCPLRQEEKLCVRTCMFPSAHPTAHGSH